MLNASLDAARRLAAEGQTGNSGKVRRYDLVFLDGDHSYEVVRAELAAFPALVAEGGVLAGHILGLDFFG